MPRLNSLDRGARWNTEGDLGSDQTAFETDHIDLLSHHVIGVLGPVEQLDQRTDVDGCLVTEHSAGPVDPCSSSSRSGTCGGRSRVSGYDDHPVAGHGVETAVPFLHQIPGDEGGKGSSRDVDHAEAVIHI